MAKISAKGAIIKHGTSASPTDEVANIKTVSLDQGNREQIDTTTHDNTVSKEYMDSKLRDTAMVEAVILYDPANTGHEAIRAAHAAGTLYYFTVVLPDAGAAQWALSGYIVDFVISPLVTNGAIEATIRFKANAAGTFTQ